MDILALSHAIYWLLGVFAAICFLIVCWWAYAGNTTIRFGGPYSKITTIGGCFCMIAALCLPLIWLAIAILSGFALFASGLSVVLSVILAIVIAVVYPIAMWLTDWIISRFIYVFVWIYYRIKEAVVKRRIRKEHEIKTK